jgi:RNA polymerase sigma-70 factor (ECF subfamily)
MQDIMTEMLTDQDVIRRVRRGDITAFEYVFKLYYPRLKLYGTRLTGDVSQAEDFVQETFAGIWEKRFLLSEKGNLKALLFKAVRNKYINYLEHNKVVDKFMKANDPDDASQGLFMLNFLDEYEFEDLRRQMMTEVERLLDTLPENCKKAFLLSRFDDMKNKEVAQTLGLNIKTVEKHLARATKLLREELKKKGFLLYFLFTLMLK